MRIGLTRTENPVKQQYYVDWLKGTEDIDIVELSWVNKNLDELIHCDGLVLSGGIDIHPKFYGSKEINYPGKPTQFDENRDEFEIAAYKMAIEMQIPVLGICRGMQLINAIHHGTLIQNLDDALFMEDHTGNPDKIHKVNISFDTILHDWTDKSTDQVNSAHHQSIDKLGDGLVINCKAVDGVVEGLELEEMTEKSFVLGIQWHPERMFRFELQNSPFSKNIRSRYLMEINKSILSKEKEHENH